MGNAAACSRFTGSVSECLLIAVQSFLTACVSVQRWTLMGVLLVCHVQALCCCAHPGALQEEEGEEGDGGAGDAEHQTPSDQDGL